MSAEERLLKILESGDESKCFRFFQGMPESQRRELAPLCLKRFRKLDRYVESAPNTHRLNPLIPVLTVAFPAVCNATELKKLGDWGTPDDDEILFKILRDRRPDWIDSWVAYQLDQSHYWRSWRLVYRLFKEGLCEKPDLPNYYNGMISGLIHDGKKELDLRKALLADPELLEHDVWRLFEYDGSTENSLAMCDDWKGRSNWGLTVIRLAKSGHISREKLIDSTFDALQCDFNHYRAKWFQDLHDALELTAKEKDARRDRYLSLFHCSARPVVSWAYAHVEALHAEMPFDAESLANGLVPVLQGKQKGIIKSTLKLLEKLAAGDADSRQVIAETAATAFIHESPDVQKAAFDLIASIGDPDDERIAGLFSQHEPVVAPSVRKAMTNWRSNNTPSSDAAAPEPKGKKKKKPTARASAIRGIDERYRKLAGIQSLQEAIQRGAPDIPAAEFRGDDIPQIGDDARIKPIEGFQQLIDLAALVIEDGNEPCEMEKVLDGVSRLCGREFDDVDVVTGPLRKRVIAILKRSSPPFSGYNPVADVCAVIHAWFSGEVVSGRVSKRDRNLVYDFGSRTQLFVIPKDNSPLTFLGNRSRRIAERVAKRQSQSLLSTPTHQGGWIDPVLLVGRVNDWSGADPAEEDVCLAMLRLAPDRRAEALKKMKPPKTEWGRAIKYALGAKRLKIGDSPKLWLTAARAASPFEDDDRVAKAFANDEPDEATAARCKPKCVSKKYSYRKTKVSELHFDITPKPKSKRSTPASSLIKFQIERSAPQCIRWVSSIWPQARESFFASGARAIGFNLDWFEAEWENKEYLWPLRESDTALHTMGGALLVLGLSAKEPGEHGLSIDHVIMAIDDGRLGTDNFASSLAILLPTGIVMPARLAKTLAVVAGASSLHGYVVQKSLQQSLRIVSQETPREIHRVFELIHEISIEWGLAITEPHCREYLEQFKTGKAAKLAKSLLALPSSDTKTVLAAQQMALEHRVKRAKRWQARTKNRASE